MCVGYFLDDCEARNRSNPTTFEIPPSEVIYGVDIGDLVKLSFLSTEEEEVGGERMWVEITGFEAVGTDFEDAIAHGSNIIRGRLRNHPVFLADPPEYNEEVLFEHRHICDVQRAP
jgi:hypothetical protein